MSVRVVAYNKTRTEEIVLLTFLILKFPKKLPKHYNFNTNKTKKKDTLHGDLLVLLSEFRV
jgi:hypothetical protein